MSSLVPFNRRRDPSSNWLSIMDNFFDDAWLPARSVFSNTFKMDVKENEKEYDVEADMPGMKKEEIHLDLNEGRLTIAVNHETETKEEKHNFIHQERRYASMQRTVYLPEADESKVSASLQDGVLHIVVEKRARSEQNRRIEIQ